MVSVSGKDIIETPHSEDFMPLMTQIPQITITRMNFLCSLFRTNLRPLECLLTIRNLNSKFDILL